MSDDASGSATAERGLQAAPAAVANFDEPDAGFVRRLQGFLHQFPTSIPFIVLLLGVIVFTIAAPGKFLSPLLTSGRICTLTPGSRKIGISSPSSSSRVRPRDSV